MRKLFPGYYTPKKEDFKKMWSDGIFILDTNVLLDLYRYSEETVRELFKVINLIKDRIWIPYQVSKEYHKNLNIVISGQVKKYTDSIETLKQFKSQIDEKRNHPFLKLEFQEEIASFCAKIHAELENRKRDIKSLILNNPIKEQLADLLDNRIGECFSQQDLTRIYAEGESRYHSDIPPGYKDKGKSIPDRYGDLVFWNEVLNKNKEIDTPIILVTGDTKEDWYYEELGLTIGPRPELIDEFNKVKSNLFHIYPTNLFLKYASQYLQTEINDKSINEVDEYIKQGRDIEQSQSISVDNSSENSTNFVYINSTSSSNETNFKEAEETNAP
ncbi:MAG: PIN-like domain-containing protein [Candidatus Kapaibacterium sp.]